MGDDWILEVHKNHRRIGFRSANCILCDIEAKDAQAARLLGCAALVAGGVLMAFALWFVVILLSWAFG